MNSRKIDILETLNRESSVDFEKTRDAAILLDLRNVTFFRFFSFFQKKSNRKKQSQRDMFAPPHLDLLPDR